MSAEGQATTAITPHVPPEVELKAEVLTLRKEKPQQGILKAYALLLSTHPGWSVSEKRFRKVLKGLEAATGQCGQEDAQQTGESAKGRPAHPRSRVVEKLDVSKWTSKVQVRYFDPVKGKGLIAKEKIEKGEVIWKEDPFIVAPEWDIYDLQRRGLACSFCTTPFQVSSSALVKNCPASPCPARFCNRLCLSRSSKTHPLVCPTQNPACVPLLRFAREHQWLALHALALCTSRILLAAQVGDDALDEDWRIVRGFAELDMEERLKETAWLASADLGPGQERALWKGGHQLLVEAFNQPPAAANKKQLAKILKKPIREDILNNIFGYDAFLFGLGRMNLNLEAHGGIYTLHSHLNHSCLPNVSVRHLETRTALSRITVIALAPIEVGEELLVTYVDPTLGVKERRERLKAWGFGFCSCKRCVTEADSLGAVGEVNALEMELRQGLGLT